MPDAKKPKANNAKNKVNPGTNGTNSNQKRVTEEELKEALTKYKGNIYDVAEYFGYKRTARNTIYRAIAQYDLFEHLKTARGYKERLKPIIGDIAKELLLDTLLSMDPGDLSKQEVILLIFALKTCAEFVEAQIKEDDVQDNSGIESLISALKESRDLRNKPDV